MLKITLLFLAVGININSFSQAAQSDVCVSIDVNEKTLYQGYDHPLHVSVEGYSVDQINLDVKGGSVRLINSTEWVIRPANGVARVQLVVSVKVKDTLTVMAKREFRVVHIPDPKPYVGTKSYETSSIKRDELITARKITATARFLGNKVNFDIKFFNCNVVEKKGKLTFIGSSNSANFSQEMLLAFADPEVSKVIINGIRVMGPDAKNRNLGALVFNLK